MPCPRAIASVAADLEFVAGRRPPLVDRATRALADPADERRAAWARVVRAAHPADGGGHVDGETFWDPTASQLELFRREVHAKARAAGPAFEAGVNPVNRHVRQRPRQCWRCRRTVHWYSDSSTRRNLWNFRLHA